MKKIRVYIYYTITHKPWGGGNSFLKALKHYINHKQNDLFEIVEDIHDDYDIFFMNGGHKNQGVYIDLQEISTIKRKISWLSFLKNHKKIVYRLDGARYKYNKTRSEMDDLQFQATQFADHIIFQSQECVESFVALGYKDHKHSIIYNGVNQTIFNTKEKYFWDGKSALKIFSANWSANIHKGYPAIAAFSEHSEVASYFVGNWHQETPSKNVNVLPPVPQEELANYYKNCDVFLHAAQNDPCPNVVLEALSCGLPVLYHNSGGTKEIAAPYGLPLPDEITPESIHAVLQEMRSRYHEFKTAILRDMEKFSIEVVGEQYLEVFKKVVNGES